MSILKDLEGDTITSWAITPGTIKLKTAKGCVYKIEEMDVGIRINYKIGYELDPRESPIDFNGQVLGVRERADFSERYGRRRSILLSIRNFAPGTDRKRFREEVKTLILSFTKKVFFVKKEQNIEECYEFEG